MSEPTRQERIVEILEAIREAEDHIGWLYVNSDAMSAERFYRMKRDDEADIDDWKGELAELNYGEDDEHPDWPLPNR